MAKTDSKIDTNTSTIGAEPGKSEEAEKKQAKKGEEVDQEMLSDKEIL